MSHQDVFEDSSQDDQKNIEEDNDQDAQIYEDRDYHDRDYHDPDYHDADMLSPHSMRRRDQHLWHAVRRVGDPFATKVIKMLTSVMQLLR